ncbi:gamma-glutamyltransferase [Paenibacillus sp. LMG 31456]|uniref:Gamma-glutamyltransferase n=1 Tax=Paenibacillus foliorum TaxID=2654974 RepID=A0A972GV54_9BACL|nr:gamma-glutamyltransferase [Paenibacillus foliorum]NOU96883.1 gamma-glutamyltransferase [Paenibacillus foliorum]
MGNGRQYCVSSAHPLATKAGMSVLRAGGNAVDAAIAISYMLGVVEPYASGIGGGGVMLILPADGRDPIVCDYREVAPMSGVISQEEVGVPGFVKGMERVHQLFGTMDIGTIMNPAIMAAEEGVPTGEALQRQLGQAQHLVVERFPELFPGGTALRAGELLKQPLLAQTMRDVRDRGSVAFYEGDGARHISAAIEGMTEEDFREYRVSVKKPIYSEYDSYDVITSPPPFGGVTLVQALKISEAIHLHKHPSDSMPYIHQWGEIIGKCYALRKTTMGDPDFCDPPVQRMLSKELIELLAASVNPDGLSQAPTTLDDVANTTHFVVSDGEGMCVSVTNTIGGFFGPGIGMGGFFLNNQLRNFTNDDSSPNVPQPGKRPQSYVCPTILRSDKQTIVIGSAGGKRIPMTLSIILQNVVKRQTGIEEALAIPRFFIDQNVVYTENRLPLEVQQSLVGLGYEVIYNPDPMFYGGVHGLMVTHETGSVSGAADPRRGGSSEVSGMEQ